MKKNSRTESFRRIVISALAITMINAPLLQPRPVYAADETRPTSEASPKKMLEQSEGIKFSVDMHENAGTDPDTTRRTDVEMLFVDSNSDLERVEDHLTSEAKKAAEASNKPVELTLVTMNEHGASEPTEDAFEGIRHLDSTAVTVTDIEDKSPKRSFKEGITPRAAWLYDKVVLVVRCYLGFQMVTFAMIQLDNISAEDASFIATVAAGATGLLHMAAGAHARYLASDYWLKMLPNPSTHPQEYQAEIAKIEEKCRSPLYRKWYQARTILKDGVIIWAFLKAYWLAKIHVGVVDLPTTAAGHAYNEVLFLGGTLSAMFVESAFVAWISKMIAQEFKNSSPLEETYISLKQKTYFCLASIMLTAPQIMFAGVAKTASTLFEIPSIGFHFTTGMAVAFAIGTSGLVTYSLEFSERYTAFREKVLGRTRRGITALGSSIGRCALTFWKS